MKSHIILRIGIWDRPQIPIRDLNSIGIYISRSYSNYRFCFYGFNGVTTPSKTVNPSFRGLVQKTPDSLVVLLNSLIAHVFLLTQLLDPDLLVVLLNSLIAHVFLLTQLLDPDSLVVLLNSLIAHVFLLTQLLSYSYPLTHRAKKISTPTDSETRASN